jgi:hypothetical protein
MPRKSEGLTAALPSRVQPDEAQMAREIAAQLGFSQNKAVRWALRYAWQHATSMTDHKTCPVNSPCAGATRGLAGRQRAAPDTDQMTITHQATMEEQ